MKILFLLFVTISINTFGQAVFISEIFADPTPSKGLPEVEFVEIYNKENFRVNLNGFYFQYGNTKVQLPESYLEPQEYAILCRKSLSEQLKPYGKVIELSNLSLNNSGATLILFNSKNEELSYVSYQNTWYTSQKDQGYSLELMDLNWPCVGASNWASSNASLGATPGKENSINKSLQLADKIEIIHSEFTNETIKLVFDKSISPHFSLENFEIINADIDIISVESANNQRNEVFIKTSNHTEKFIDLNIYSLKNCLGNFLDEQNIRLKKYFDPEPQQIQISEILFDPKVGGQDFVELYNTSDQDFNLKNWMFANRNAQGQVASLRKISSQDLVLKAFEYKAFTTDKDFLLKNYPFTGNIEQILSLPSYPNTGGFVLLLKPDSSIFDEVNYNAKQHLSLLNNPDGVSLEKTSFSKNLWKTAASEVGYATPGLPNSQQEDDNLIQDFYAEPIVFNPHQGAPAETFLKYSLKEGGNYAEIKIFDANGKEIRTLANNLILGTKGQISWDGRDTSGKVLPVGYYVFSIKVFGPFESKKYLAKAVIGSQ